LPGTQVPSSHPRGFPVPSSDLCWDIVFSPKLNVVISLNSRSPWAPSPQDSWSFVLSSLKN
jgi:hypothetical protein